MVVETALLAQCRGTVVRNCRAGGAGERLRRRRYLQRLPPAGGATVEVVRLLKEHGEGLVITAAGGINDPATVRAMIDAGADRIAVTDLSAIVTL